MKMQLFSLASVALSFALATSQSRADMMPVNLEFTFRDYQSLAKVSCNAHGDWATGHDGHLTYNGENDHYWEYSQRVGYYNNSFQFPYGHEPAETDANAWMNGYGGTHPGSASIGGSAGMTVMDGYGTVALTCGTSASGNRSEYGWATATCTATVRPGGTLHVGTSPEYKSGDPLWLEVDLACNNCFSWYLKVAGREYSSCFCGESVWDLFPVTAGMNTNLEFSCTGIYGLPPGYELNETGNCYLELTLMDEVIPEPSTLALLCSGLLACLAFAWRRR